MGSLCAHVFFYIVVSGPLLFFMTALQRHEPVETTLVYVTLGELKERLEPAAAKSSVPAAKAPDVKRADHAEDNQKGITAATDVEDTVPPQDTETAATPSDEVHGAETELLTGPDKDEGVTFIRGDTKTFEKFDEKKNAAEAKEIMNTLAVPETVDNGRFSAYSTVKQPVVLKYSTKRAMAEAAVPSPPQSDIGLEVPQPTLSGGLSRATSSPISKETSGPGSITATVVAVPVQKQERIASKAPSAYASGGASAVPSPDFSAVSQKAPNLPGRVFTAADSQTEPAKSNTITSGKGEAGKPAPPVVRITSPPAGLSDKKVVAVKGKISGYGILSVVLTAGGRQKELLVREGEFESEVTLDEGRNLLRVDTADASGEMASDMVEVVYSAPVDPQMARMDLVVRIEYSVGGGSLSTSHKWAPHPLYRDSGHAVAPEFKEDHGPKGGSVSVSKALPGIYTIGVGYDTTSSGPVDATFDVTVFGHDPARRKNRKIGPVRLVGKGFIPAVRLLFPEGVFWEDDGWFSGVMESGRTTTKYKMPEGIVWKERD